MRLVTVIVNYRTPTLVIDCLESLLPELDAFGDAQVLIVDNQSGDDSVERIQRAIDARGWQRVTLLPQDRNGGFSFGNNAGIRHSLESEHPADLFLLCNSDTIIRPGAVAELVNTMQSHPEVGLIGPQLEWMDGEKQVNCRRWPKPSTELVRAAATGFVTKLFPSAEVSMPIPDGPMMNPEWITFAAILIRREVFEQAGLMDEGYFMYSEDIDYCRRAREAGWNILYWPNARIVHLKGGSSPVQSLSVKRRRRPSYYYESRARYYAKFYGRFGLWRANAYWMIGRCVSLLRELLQRKPRMVCEAEWRDNWRNARQPLRDHSLTGSMT